MAEEPDNLVLKLLREMRDALEDVRGKTYEHDRRFDELNRKIDDWQETTATGLGLAGHANIRTGALEREVEQLKRRVEELERAH